MTLARRAVAGDGVAAADLTLSDLAAALERQEVTPSTELAVFNQDGRVWRHAGRRTR